jgi:hypothetical protein
MRKPIEGNFSLTKISMEQDRIQEPFSQYGNAH